MHNPKTTINNYENEKKGYMIVLNYIFDKKSNSSRWVHRVASLGGSVLEGLNRDRFLGWWLVWRRRQATDG